MRRRARHILTVKKRLPIHTRQGTTPAFPAPHLPEGRANPEKCCPETQRFLQRSGRRAATGQSVQPREQVPFLPDRDGHSPRNPAPARHKLGLPQARPSAVICAGPASQPGTREPAPTSSRPWETRSRSRGRGGAGTRRLPNKPTQNNAAWTPHQAWKGQAAGNDVLIFTAASQ